MPPEVIQPQAQPAPAAPAAPVAAEKPVSVAETVKAAFDKSSPNVSGTPQADASTAPKPAPAADANAAPKPGEQPEAKPGETPEQTAERVRTDRIPVGWKGGAEAWHKLDASAKTYIVERNKQFEQGIQKHAQAANFAAEMAREFQPYEALLRSMQATPQMASRFLMDKFYTLHHGSPAAKQQLIVEMAKTAGVDLSGINQGEAPQVDPNLAALEERVRQLTGYIQGQQQTAQSAEQQYIHSEIDKFAADPAHEHFESVRPVMAALLSGGQAKDLKHAYELACWANPDVRASLVNQHHAQDAEKRKKQAEESQRANVSLNAAPPAATVDGGSLSIRDLVASSFARASGRV